MRTSVAGMLAVAGRASVLSGVVLTFILTTILGECVGGWELFKSSFVSPKLQFPASTVRKTITVSIFLCPLWGWETTMNGKGLLSYRLPCKWEAALSLLLVITVIIMEMSQQDRMRLLFTGSPMPCLWDSETQHLHRKWEGRKWEGRFCKRGRAVRPATRCASVAHRL